MWQTLVYQVMIKQLLLYINSLKKLYWVPTLTEFRQVSGFPGILVFSTNKTDRHNITEILLKVTVNTINLTPHTDCGWDYYSNTIELYREFLLRHSEAIYFSG